MYSCSFRVNFRSRLPIDQDLQASSTVILTRTGTRTLLTMADAPAVITLPTIEDAIAASPTFEIDLINAIEQGFVDYSNGKFNAAPIQTLGTAPLAAFTADDRNPNSTYAAQTCVKSGYFTGADHYVVKVAAGGYPMPANTGNIQVYSQSTGRLIYLLLDEGILTEHRTAAAGAVAARKFACTDTTAIGIVGTGVQARYQLRYLRHVTTCRNVFVWGRTPAHVQAFVADGLNSDWNIRIAASPEEIMTTCQLIVTTTSAREAVLYDHPNRPRPQHITCIGADAPGKQELDSEIVLSADYRVADALAQTAVRGEFQTALREGRVAISSIQEMGKRLEKSNNVCTNAKMWTIFDSSGVAFQDCVIASLVGALLKGSS